MELKEIKIKNFMSFGNHEQVLKLNNKQCFSLEGKNGQGKSSLSNAIAFALFGKPLKNIKKSEIPNNINKKDCLVKLTFSCDNKEYKVIRGISPNIFEIYEDNELINKSSSVVDYQTILERDIIGYNIDLFKQLIILSGSDFVPFLKMTNKNRRNILEELLSLTELTKMEKQLKGYIAENKSALRETTAVLREVTDGIKRQNEVYKKSSENTQEKIKSLKDKIKETEGKIEEINTNIQEKQSQVDLEKLSELEKELSDLHEKGYQCSTNLGKIAASLKSVQEKAEFLQESDSCHVCKQDIDPEFKEKELKNIQEKESKLNDALSQLNQTNSDYSTKANEIKSEIEKLQGIKSFISTAQNELEYHKKTIQSLNDYINESTESDNTHVKDEIMKLSARYTELQDSLQDLNTRSEIYTIARSFLSDDGVRKSIIKKYIPYITQRINYWLKEFEMFATVYIDEDFNEEIKMRGFDKTRFESCSQGEQTRLTLSTVLAFRELLSLRNKEELKFLLLDEVFENIDYSGKINLINNLKDISHRNGITILVVSHSNIEDDVFDGEITIKKQGNFSIIQK